MEVSQMASTLTPEQRRQRAQLAAQARWARTPDRTAATCQQRSKFMERFAKQVEKQFPNADPATRAKLIESSKNEYFTRLAYKSSRARNKAAGRQQAS